MAYKIGKWNLEDITKEKSIDRRIKETEEKVKKFETYKNKLSPDVDVKIINEMIDISEEILETIAPAFVYSGIGFEANTNGEKFIHLLNVL